MTEKGRRTQGGFGFYYSHVHFRDEGWLKLAALYLDGIYRLEAARVNSSLQSILPSEVELYGEGFLKFAHPDQNSLRIAAERFTRIIEQGGIKDFGFPAIRPRDRFELRSKYLERMRRSISQHAEFRGDVQISDYFATWKATPELIDRLVDIGLAYQAPGDSMDRVWMPAPAARAYLLVLGMHMASAHAAVPVADDEQSLGGYGLSPQRLMAALRYEGHFSLRDLRWDRDGFTERTGKAAQAVAPRYDGEITVLLANLAIKTVIPRDIAAVPIGKIIEFRRRYHGERARFRAEVDRMINEAVELEAVNDRQVLIDHLQTRFNTLIMPALRDLERAMRGLRMDTVSGTMAVQIAAPPAAAGALALLALHPATPIVAAISAAGFALGVWKSARDGHSRKNAELAKSPAAYLYHLRTDLDPLSLSERIQSAAAHFAPTTYQEPSGNGDKSILPPA